MSARGFFEGRRQIVLEAHQQLGQLPALGRSNAFAQLGSQLAVDGIHLDNELLAGRGALDRAIELAGRGIEVAPLSDAPYRAQAHAYAQRGDRDSARAVLTLLFDRLRAEDLEPETASVVLAGRFGLDTA